MQDERVYCLMNPERPGRIDAMGVRLMGRPDFLVGIYLSWANVKDQKAFLWDVVEVFGEVRLCTLVHGFPPALWCKMSISVPYLRLLDEKASLFKKIRVALLEIRASNPKPFLGLSYNQETKLWEATPVAQLAGIDSNFDLIPN